MTYAHQENMVLVAKCLDKDESNYRGFDIMALDHLFCRVGIHPANSICGACALVNGERNSQFPHNNLQKLLLPRIVEHSAQNGVFINESLTGALELCYVESTREMQRVTVHNTVQCIASLYLEGWIHVLYIVPIQ
jgi:hypothetical protein